jgi:hypothetical protein
LVIIRYLQFISTSVLNPAAAAKVWVRARPWGYCGRHIVYNFDDITSISSSIIVNGILIVIAFVFELSLFFATPCTPLPGRLHPP